MHADEEDENNMNNTHVDKSLLLTFCICFVI